MGVARTQWEGERCRVNPNMHLLPVQAKEATTDTQTRAEGPSGGAGNLLVSSEGDISSFDSSD